MDNNIFAYDKCIDVFKWLYERNIRCDFNQGLDFRLANNDNMYWLTKLSYLKSEYIFAFDDIKYINMLNSKIDLLKKYIPKDWKIKFYIYVHPSMDIKDTIKRVEWCREHKCLPFIMKDFSCNTSLYKEFYTDYAGYCNMPSFFKNITFGWNSGGIGYKYGFEIKRILMVPHGGWHNDTICTVEVKTHEGKNDNVISTEEVTNMLNSNDIKLIDKLKTLPVDYWDFKGEDVREYTHGIHNYPAMMVYPISRNIIRMVSEIQSITALLDPFAGSGTVLVEGMLKGIKKVSGNDINPLALYLTKVKTTPLNDSILNIEIKNFIKKNRRKN